MTNRGGGHEADVCAVPRGGWLSDNSLALGLTRLQGTHVVDYMEEANGELGASTEELRHELYSWEEICPATRRLRCTCPPDERCAGIANWIIRSETDLALPRWYLRRRRIRRAA